MRKVLANVLLATSLAFTAVLPALAQTAGDGSTGQDVTNNTVAGPGIIAGGGYTGGSLGGGVFSIPNYEDDTRNADMYEYLHPSAHPAWQSYRVLVTQIANQSIGAVPVPHFPEMGSNAGYENAIYLYPVSGGSNAGTGGAGGGGMTSSGVVAQGGGGIITQGAGAGLANGAAGAGVTTSVTGQVTNPMNQPVPGLVGN